MTDDALKTAALNFLLEHKGEQLKFITVVACVAKENTTNTWEEAALRKRVFKAVYLLINEKKVIRYRTRVLKNILRVSEKI